MLSQSMQLTGISASATLTMETIKTRFGDITVDTSKAVVFARGMLGLPDKHNFVLANFPNPKMQQFMLFQSLDDRALSFITLPLDIKNNIIAEADIEAACRDLQVSAASAAILLIVNVHRSLDQVKLSVNARAPLIIDADRKIGAQYVFTQDNYNVQHML
jgi:flagellar assembly factor FliW